MTLSPSETIDIFISHYIYSGIMNIGAHHYFETTYHSILLLIIKEVYTIVHHKSVF